MTGTIKNNKARKNNYMRAYMRINNHLKKGMSKQEVFEEERAIMLADLRKISWQQMIYFVSVFFPTEKAYFKRVRKENRRFTAVRNAFKNMYLDNRMMA